MYNLLHAQLWFQVCVFAADGCVKGSARECECPGKNHSAISSKQVAACPSFSQRNNASFFKRLNNPILTNLSSSVDFAQSVALGRERPQPDKHLPLGSGSTLSTRFSSSICRHCLLLSHPLRTLSRLSCPHSLEQLIYSNPSTTSFPHLPSFFSLVAVCLRWLWSGPNDHEKEPNTFWFVLFFCCIH